MRRSLVRILLGALVLITPLLVLKLFYSSELTAPNRGLAAYLKAPVELLLIGSSHTRYGYDVHALESRLQRSVFDLSYNDLSLTYTRIILQWLFESHQLPKLTLIELNSGQQGDAASLRDTRLVLDAPWTLKRKIAEQYCRGSSSLRARVRCGLNLYSLFVTQDNELLFGFPWTQAFFSKDSYRGAYEGLRNHGLDKNQLEALLSDKPPRPAGVGSTQTEALRELVLWLRRAQVPAAFVELPTPSLQPSRISHVAAEKLGGFPYWDPVATGEFDASEPSYFMDSEHLSDKGRGVFTVWIAHQLARISQR